MEDRKMSKSKTNSRTKKLLLISCLMFLAAACSSVGSRKMVFSTPETRTVADARPMAKMQRYPVPSKPVEAKAMPAPQYEAPYGNTEEYDEIYENRFLDAVGNPLSTFSIDVDTASYANARRFIRQGSLPVKDSVRIEELINYFSYDYPDPEGPHPFNFVTETAACPWNPDALLLHVGLQGKRIATEDLPPNNLVFLIDVSGSMGSANKLPLLKTAFRMLVDQMRAQDRVAIVVYAGAAGLVLDSTTGRDKEIIIRAIDRLSSGGSTAGGAGIRLAYNIAVENFDSRANNRVILATDGDFNVGASSDAEMVRLIEEKREYGVFLTVLGFGMGNYKDSKMEKLADKGNGNYAYIDTAMEAKKVLINEMGSTLLTIAKDVKIQIEFNPAKVKSYRLVGYENRMLRAKDFDDDKKDAGELGAGHTVTALYEIIPTSMAAQGRSGLRYQTIPFRQESPESFELANIKFRYKRPDERESILITQPILDERLALAETSNAFKFSAAVAEWGLLLRDSEHKAYASYEQTLQLAKEGEGADLHGYRAEFISLVKTTRELAGQERHAGRFIE